MYLKLILFIILFQILSVDLLPQRRFLDLKGIEDSLDNTYLFYRILDTDFYCALFYIHKFNTSTNEDEYLIPDASCFYPEGYSYTNMYDYVFYNNSSYLKLFSGDYRGNFSSWVEYSFIYDIDGIIHGWPYDTKITNLEISRQNNNYLYASMRDNSNNYGILISSDGGYNWDTLSLGDYLLRSVSTLNDSLFFSSSDQGLLYKSTNSGADYLLVDSSNTIDWKIEWYGNLRYAGHFKFLYDTDGQHVYTVATNTDLNMYYFLKSEDAGGNWQIKDSSSTPIYIDIDYSQSGVIYKCAETTIYRSTDYGESFDVFKEIVSPTIIRGIYKKPASGILYVFTEYVLYEVTSSSVTPILIISDVEDEHISPDSYSLSQNYPNPFNPSTTIKYQIPEVSLVTIKVYDVLGNEIATLVNEEKTAGNYEVEFDGTGFPSGVYLYRLSVNNGYNESRKMVLLK